MCPTLDCVCCKISGDYKYTTTTEGVVAFLKRYTSVSNDFIDDLFSVVDPFAGKNAFVVNADVHLTTECFKCLCMMVNTPKSKQARAYFIAVEDTLLRYIEASLM